MTCTGLAAPQPWHLHPINKTAYSFSCCPGQELPSFRNSNTCLQDSHCWALDAQIRSARVCFDRNTDMAVLSFINSLSGQPYIGWGKEEWSQVEVLLKCGTGKDASTKQELQVYVYTYVHHMYASSTDCFSVHTCTLVKRVACKWSPAAAQRAFQTDNLARLASDLTWKHGLTVQDIWPHLSNLKWIHSASAGVEKLLFPELVKSQVVVTNAKVGCHL